MSTKKCSNCFQLKSTEDFYTRKYLSKKGTQIFPQSRCKACNSEVVRGWKMRWLEKQRKKEAV